MLSCFVIIFTDILEYSLKQKKIYTVLLGSKKIDKKVQVGKDQENAQSEKKDSHSKNQGGKKPN